MSSYVSNPDGFPRKLKEGSGISILESLGEIQFLYTGTGIGNIYLTDLSDTSIVAPQLNQILIYITGSKWANRAPSSLGMVSGSGTTGYIPQWFGGGLIDSIVKITGSGIVISEDVRLYRSSAGVLRTPGNVIVDNSVGIGTLAPLNKLDVIGTAYISGTLQVIPRLVVGNYQTLGYFNATVGLAGEFITFQNLEAVGPYKSGTVIRSIDVTASINRDMELLASNLHLVGNTVTTIGTVYVSGTSTFANNLNVYGNEYVSGTLNVNNTTSLLGTVGVNSLVYTLTGSPTGTSINLASISGTAYVQIQGTAGSDPWYLNGMTAKPAGTIIILDFAETTAKKVRIVGESAGEATTANRFRSNITGGPKVEINGNHGIAFCIYDGARWAVISSTPGTTVSA